MRPRGVETVATRTKFSSQADPALLEAMREIAKTDGRQFQAVMEDAIRDYIENRVRAKPRPHVMAHFEASLARNRRLLELLAR